MTDIQRYDLKTREEMFKALADRVLETLVEGIREHDGASLVLSGGGTPLPLFKALAQREFEWGFVTATLADERWVGPEHARSNEKLVRENLIQNHASSMAFVGLKNDAESPEAGETACQRTLEMVARPFDMVVLGMGDDGHTASFFPYGEGLETALRPADGKLCAAVRAEGAGEPRISLTLPAILNAREIVLLITGPTKAKVLEQALGDGDEAEMPVRAVLRQSQTPVRIYWSE